VHGLVVGIGASVGGLEAFKRFFANMPPDTGMAFVLVQHLSPDHSSILTDLIGRSTAMRVVEARNNATVVRNRIYVTPPNATLTIANRRLRVVKPAPPRENRHPIDTFMYSLAEDQGENAVCVILSGSGSDGAQGLAAIKEHGGITLAQAQFDETAMSGMPSSAAATGLVDHVLPVDAMPAKLIEYQQHLIDVRGRRGSEGVRQDARRHLDEVCGLLDKAVGHDFSQYKEGTLVRRIQRRMQVRNLDDVAEYIAYLRKEPREVELLFRDLLIGVTQFFRDAEAFEALATTVVPELVKNKGAEDQLRVWVPGCATGEEAYSIAILLQEAAAKVRVVPKFLIFGTDINDTAIAMARSGRYHKSRLEGLSSERVGRWFVEDGEYYCPVVEIREACVFSVHSIIKDPPFSRLHLIACRNLLIYMDGSAQDRIVRLFHYALRPGGYLFLGPSESVTRQGEFFAVLDKKHRLFQRNDSATSTLPSFALLDATISGGGRDNPAPSETRPESIFDRGARRVMEKYSPAYLVVDRQHQVLRFCGKLGKYLEPSEGPPSFNLFSLIQSALRPPVRDALREAASTQRRVMRRGVPIEADRKSPATNLIVEPILQASGAAKHYVVAFQDLASIGDVDNTTSIEVDNLTVRELEHELRATRARLQAAIDEAERANEELRSANEEYRSANEEIQSSNEELESSKEELQSLNEELQTLNSELLRKNETLVEANSDLHNFLDGSEIAMLFLDNELRIRKFTPSATEIFHLRDTDRGRPITDIASRLGYQALEEDVKECLRSLTAVEREVQVPQGAITFIMRIRPYRAITGTIDGVIITFTDISDRKRHEEAQARLAAIVESSQDAVIGHALDHQLERRG
jgi:two-component system, chemotaxis family, CheB/CheR fusion protein